jgi:hypothetical protein
MPNPVINPAWGVDLAYTVTNSDYLAVDARLSELDEEPAQIDVTVPAAGRVHAVRDPASWAAGGVEILGVGGWAVGPVVMGNWTLTVSAGAAVTDPASIEITNGNGLSPNGLVRLIFTTLGGAACDVSPGGGTLSIDRLLASPSIINPQVTSGLPVHELDAVTLGATVQATQQVNPAPSVPLSALPAIVSGWEPEPTNPVAVSAFVSAGANASFTAPAAYDTASLDFRLTAGYDLDASGTIGSSEPVNEHVLSLDVETVVHGMLLVLDRSGSMGSSLGSTTKWNGTVQAAHAWLDLFRTFRTGEGHKAGIVTFEHGTCNWVLSPAANVTVRNPQTGAAELSDPMTDLADLGDDTLLTLGNPQSCTPIGDALIKGLDVLQSNLEPGSVASVVLLTDGYENSGRVTIAASAGPAAETYNSAKASYPFGTSLLGDRLFTIGVGASVDEDRLADLPAPAGANMGPGYYRLTTDVKEILPTFADMLGVVLDAQRVLPTLAVTDPDSPAHAMYFDVPTGEQRVALLVPWANANDNLLVAWRLQSSNGPFAVVNSVDASVVGSYRRQGHGLMTVDVTGVTGSGDPPATQWRVQHRNMANTPQPLTDADVLCMVDLVTKAEIRLDKPRYFIGDAINITCSIRSGGTRVTGTSVGVDVARPGEGLGTFLATNSGLYKQKQRSTKPEGPDPDAGKGLMFKTILQLKGMDSLPVLTPPAFHLQDDGAHGDGAANDGDYANSFTDTTKEGTYTFRFRIEGTLADGSRFSRLFVRSTWVGVKPDPVATTMAWTTLGGLPSGQSGQLLTIKPVAANGELLGPFRHDVITVTVSHGVLDGALVDNLDGSYSQRVLYKGGEDPIVNVEIYGAPMRPTGPTLGDGTSCLRLWIKAILCTLRKILRMIAGK